MHLVIASALTGAHIVRAPSGLTIATGLLLASRLRSLTMLTAPERRALRDRLGVVYPEWTSAGHFGARRVPATMRLPWMSYEADDCEPLAQRLP